METTAVQFEQAAFVQGRSAAARRFGVARFEAHAALEAEVFANLPLLGGRRLLHRRNEATTRQIPQTRRGLSRAAAQSLFM